jgi:putative ABC transport system permease protein
MAIILIYVINLRSFGWSLQLQLNFEIFFFAMLIAIFASLLAGIYPSWRLNRMEIATALREE